jgi:glycerol-3-phosphate O-acyltransferase
MCAILLSLSGLQAMSTEELAVQCNLCADRLSHTHGHDNNELFDKHLHQQFLLDLQQQGYIRYTDDTVVARQELIAVEKEARALLPESSRHAIIAAAKAVATARTSKV